LSLIRQPSSNGAGGSGRHVCGPVFDIDLRMETVMTNPTTNSTEAAPATGSSCGCGSAPASAALAPVAAEPCCGTSQGAARAGACCDPAAKTEAVAAGASCCG